MSASAGLIADWIKNKLPWKWVYSPKKSPLVIKAGKEVKFSEHTHPEGILSHAIAAFDHPECGIRLRSEPTLDTGRSQKISTGIAGGGYLPNKTAWVSIPPTTHPGIYILNYVSETPWLKHLETYLFNDDNKPHRYISGGYLLAVLTKERPEPIDQALLDFIKENQKGVND